MIVLNLFLNFEQKVSEPHIFIKLFLYEKVYAICLTIRPGLHLAYTHRRKVEKQPNPVL